MTHFLLRGVRPLLTGLWITLAPGAVLAGELEITYLGNEGFLLESNDRKVLVDALVSRDMPGYVQQSEELRGKLEQALPPFDGVELLLVTHVHGDHFGAESVAHHLSANSHAELVSTEQVVARLRERSDFEEYGDRVHAARPGKEPVSFERWKLDVLAMHHGKTRRPPILNHGYVLELGGMSVLHMGDTEVTAAELAEMKLVDRAIDVALVPSWYFDASPWKGAIESSIQPQHAVVMHLAPDWSRSAKTALQRESRARVPRIRKAYPDAIVFDAPLQSHRFGDG